ncbi:MAG: protein kinase [Candidatus Latescibacterota bacterium]|nr:MAG: protein kinase [Candidatus Latescibacterota bacterium]
MIGQTISHYRILERLGGGGMGIVYKAQDTRLKRVVALKFLPTTLTDDEDLKKRFVREAQAASALDHPNICTIHEIDETLNGQLFICMAFYDGETVKKKIARGPLAVKAAINVAIRVAQGLAKAHSRGMVHRDIKPANIMVTDDGQVKIVDFGLAQLAGLAKITKIGKMVGTVAYMSPEQLTGKELDSRTDIWSLGVVVYEMLSGKLPFTADYRHALMYMILNEAPKPLAFFRSDIPDGIQRVVGKALEKNRGDRYQSVTTLGEELSAACAQQAVVTQREKSIVVLPFADLSPQKDQEYFCDGIAEEIINKLARLRSLRVASRTSAFAFKGRNEDIREIGAKLGVNTMLEGSVRKEGDRLRVTAQLLNVEDGYHLWSERYDCELKNVFDVQDEISDNVIRSLEIKLSQEENHAVKKVMTQNVVAYDLYLRGRDFFHQRHPKAIRYAIEMFSRAIEKDASYALAHAGIADCYCFLSYFDDNAAYSEQCMTATEKALELDPELAEAHVSRGLALSTFSKQYGEAEIEFDTAIELDPELFEAYYLYAHACRTQGKMDKAARLLEMACIVRPEDYQAPNHLAMAYTALNEKTKAELAYRRCVENAEKHLELNPDDARGYQLGGISLIQLGEREKGIGWARRAAEMDPGNPVYLYNTACILSVAGETEEAIDCFDRAIASGYRNKGFILNDPDLDPIRNHPRFLSLMERLK